MRLIVVMHDLFEVHKDLAPLIYKALKYSETQNIVDLCSGSGGPMYKLYEILKDKYEIKNLSLIFTDLYPDFKLAYKINYSKSSQLTYITQPVNATDIDPSLKGVRTIVSSFHHMKPEIARHILEDAKQNRQPICIFEISDNSAPYLIRWIGLPINFLMTFFITPLARPLTWQQLIFTYLIPIIPLCFAWDGAVSNARTYSIGDLDILLDGLESDFYKWEKGTISGKIKKLYLLGYPL